MHRKILVDFDFSDKDSAKLLQIKIIFEFFSKIYNLIEKLIQQIKALKIF